MPKDCKRLIAVTGVGIALAPATLAVGAQAEAEAAQPRWHITHLNSLAGEDGFADVAAAGRRGAWAVGDTHIYQGRDHWYEPMVRRYDGRAWRPVRVPLGRALLTSVAASSDRNVWILAQGWVGTPDTLLHWNGRRWSSRRTGGTYPRDVATVGTGQAFVVGAGKAGRSRVERWDGRRWRTDRGPMGVLNAVSARSAKDAWATGYRGDQRS